MRIYIYITLGCTSILIALSDVNYNLIEIILKQVT